MRSDMKTVLSTFLDTHIFLFTFHFPYSLLFLPEVNVTLKSVADARSSFQKDSVMF